MLLTVTTPDHLLFGSDYPFVPDDILKKVVSRLKKEITDDSEIGVYSEDIFRNNAMKLFGKTNITPK